MLERWRPRPLLLQDDGATDGERRWPGFAAWCTDHAAARCALAVSSAWLREIVAEPGLPLPDGEAVLAWARPLLVHYHGDAAAGWPLAAWRDGAVRGASALVLPLPPLKEAAAATGVRLAALRPWWSVALPAALRAAPALRGHAAELLIVEGALVTAIALRGGRVEAVEIRRLDAATPAALDEWCAERPARARAVLGCGFAAGSPRAAVVLDALDAAQPARRWIGGGA